ncbi:MAG: hypothetical protein ACMUHX_00925 [bacterium]
MVDRDSKRLRMDSFIEIHSGLIIDYTPPWTKSGHLPSLTSEIS